MLVTLSHYYKTVYNYIATRLVTYTAHPATIIGFYYTDTLFIYMDGIYTRLWESSKFHESRIQ